MIMLTHQRFRMLKTWSVPNAVLGRRVPENTSLGTDHGTANVMFFAGRQVKGGHYGTPSDLGALDAGDNLVHTTDFRSVYASAIDGWLRVGAADRILKGRFAPLPVFA